MSCYLVESEKIASLAKNEKVYSLPVFIDEYGRPHSYEHIFSELNFLNALSLLNRYGDKIIENIYTDIPEFDDVPILDNKTLQRFLGEFLYQCDCAGTNNPIYKELFILAKTLSSFFE